MSSTTASGRKSRRRGDRVGARVGHLQVPALVAQGHREELGDVDLVVDDEDAYGGAVGSGELLHGSILPTQVVSFL